MSRIGIDHEPSRDPFCSLEQCQRVGQNIFPVFCSEQRKADRSRERRLEIERIGRGDRRVEDIPWRRLKAVAIEHAGFGVECRSIQHSQCPAGGIWLAPNGR